LVLIYAGQSLALGLQEREAAGRGKQLEGLGDPHGIFVESPAAY